MLKTKSPKKRCIVHWTSFLFMTFLPVVCFSQVLNGSFEIDGQPSLDSWLISCNDGESFQDAPSGGGVWCLRLPVGNLQGCFPESADQSIEGFKSGDILKVSVWARQDEIKVSHTSVCLKIVPTHGKSTILSADTTTSTEWTQLTIVDTLFLEEGDNMVIILDAGITSGPQILGSYSYFDLVDAEKIGEIIVPINDSNDLHPKDFKLFQNYPNPFNPSTTIEFYVPKTSEVILKIYNILGEEVATLVSDRLTAGNYTYQWDASNLVSGVYLYRLLAGDYIETRKMILMR